MDNEFIVMCVKFDFYFHLESREQSNEQMIMKCTNLIQQNNKNSDDNNQDSRRKRKKQKKKDTRAYFYCLLFF